MKLRWDTDHWKLTDSNTSDGTTTYIDCAFESIVADSSIGTDATLLLQALGFLKYDSSAGAYQSDRFYANSYEAERSFYCGGFWVTGAYAGVFYALGGSARSITLTYLGFRAAYCVLPS